MLETAHARIGGAISVRALAMQIILLLARLPPSVAKDNAEQRVAAVSREVEEMLYDEWNLDRAALRAGLSRRRFSDLFRKQHGVTFKERLVDLRLTHAARLLRAGEHSTMAVMFSCGFNDLSHFYRLFRQRFGAAPKAWLRADNTVSRKPET
jgi:AraC-like DNA-binding protein